MTGPDLASAADIGAARRLLTQLFEQAGIDSPSLDARLLTGHALALDHTALASSAARKLTQDERCAIAAHAARRLGGEPVARILGAREFWGLPFRLSRATLVPRPETETVVEAALAAVDAKGRRHDTLLIADLGIGSGAILLALLHELPNAFGVGTDRDEDAIATARGNADTLGLAARSLFVRADFAAPLARRFDLVVSNPPYIATDEIASLAREVREHDPHLALDGGADGLTAYRAIARQASGVLRADGSLIVEIGRGQAADVTALMTAGGSLEPAGERADLAGIPRALAFRRTAV